MDCMLSSNVSVYKEQQLQSQYAQTSWSSATQAGENLVGALYHSTQTPIPPADYTHRAPSGSVDPLSSLARKISPLEKKMRLPSRHESYGERPEYSGGYAHPDDVLLLVGKNRKKFYLNAETLISGSAYFKHLLQHLHSPSPLNEREVPISRNYKPGFTCPPIAIDCEEHVFEGLLLLMRYGTLEALPAMSRAETFRLKKEAEFFGIHYMEPRPESGALAAESGDDCSNMCSVGSRSSSPSGSPKSMASDTSSQPGLAAKGVCQHARSGRFKEAFPLACITQRQLAELPQFPSDLADPARLVLVSCLSQEKASIYTCTCGSKKWALNFYHRHAFCVSCSHPPNVSCRHFAEMFMAAAAHYSSGQAVAVESSSSWWVSFDSTCMLRFISCAGDGPDACSCSGSSTAVARKAAQPTVWATNCFYSHAFCTCCGQAARGPVLLSLILTLRYGGSSKASKCSSATSSFRIPA